MTPGIQGKRPLRSRTYIAPLTKAEYGCAGNPDLVLTQKILVVGGDAQEFALCAIGIGQRLQVGRIGSFGLRKQIAAIAQ